MNRYQQLVPQMAAAMMIGRGATETDAAYRTRVLYSALGRLAYASLWDTLEEFEHEEVSISEIHFKRRMTSLIQTYHHMYPELQHEFFPDAQDGCQMIYELFQGREMYHSPYRLMPAATASAGIGNIAFLRGADPLLPGSVSGLGCYAVTEASERDAPSVADMYQFAEQHPTTIWEYVCGHAKWQVSHHPESLMYLRTKPPFPRGYWQKQADLGLSLARTIEPDQRLYYLCRSDHQGVFVSQLPEWRTEKGEYRLLAVGLLLKQKQLPPIMFHLDGERVMLRIQYLLPPNEQGFLELYTWPGNYLSAQSSFQRICSTPIFPALRQVLETAGYSFAEE